MKAIWVAAGFSLRWHRLESLCYQTENRKQKTENISPLLLFGGG